ncbi:IS256 family transposase [Pectinatus haikarae]|uniref:IS256 family transposase n=1 Tax=Pectinatus haikarae TaxID=349096 RepID=UPI001E5F60FE|nr:transposase [Pectinatus haikarae]
MSRKNESTQKAAMREMMKNYLKDTNTNVRDGADVKNVMRDMMSVLLEGALDGELDESLGYSKYDYKNKETGNSRNGHSNKTMHTSYGDMNLAVPRDRNGEYEPQIVKKYQNTVTQDMEEKIISMYAKGMTTSDIESHMQNLYGLEISDSTISRITDKIMPLVKEWQERPLAEVYAVVFMDAIHYHVRCDGHIVKRDVYIALAHNHPSGDSAPSEEDKAVTKRLTVVGKIIGIPLLDHIIIGRYGSLSMKQRKESTG